MYAFLHMPYTLRLFAIYLLNNFHTYHTEYCCYFYHVFPDVPWFFAAALELFISNGIAFGLIFYQTECYIHVPGRLCTTYAAVEMHIECKVI